MVFRFLKFAALAVVAALGIAAYAAGPHVISDLAQLVYGTPHQQYVVRLKYTSLGQTPEAREWIASADRALQDPTALQSTDGSQQFVLDGHAVAFAATLRRGQRYVVTAADGAPVFIDLFKREDGALAPIANAAVNESVLATEIRSDGEYVVRVQPPLRGASASGAGSIALTLDVEPTLLLPVQRAKQASIGSFFGAARDGGRRAHQGVDIFAPKGTPVLAASDGIVTSVGVNGLGGNVVWVTRPGHLERQYYAHLDRQRVTPGTFVRRGDVIGTVGNTGNARGTPPHLHFGIYAFGGAVDPLPYIADRPARAQASRLRHNVARRTQG